MNIDEYRDMWAEDAAIDTENVHVESLKVPKLHSKYLIYLSKERVKYKTLMEKRNKLASDLEEYFLGRLDGKEIGRPAHQTIDTKTSAQRKIQADADMQKLNLALIVQEEIMLFLKDIIQSIHNRNFTIKNYIDYKKFLNGA